MAIRKLNTRKYHSEEGLTGTSVCPEVFSAEIDGTEAMEELVVQTAYQIQRRLEGKLVYPSFDAIHTRVSDDKAIDEENGLAGFVLFYRRPVSSGTRIREGIYGIKREGNRLNGRLYAYYSQMDGDNNKFHIANIQNGKLNGSIVKRKTKENFSYDLNEL